MPVTTPPNSPLGEEHFRQLQDAMDHLKMARQQIQTAQMAGISSPEQAQKVADLESQILKIRQAYFPGRTL